MDLAPDLAANRDRTQRIATTAPADSAVRLTISHSLMRAVLWSPRKLITDGIALPEAYQQTAPVADFFKLCPAARDPTFYRAMAPYLERFFFVDENSWMYRELLKYQTQLRALIIWLEVETDDDALDSLLKESLLRKCRLLRRLKIVLPPLNCHVLNFVYAWLFMEQARDKIHHLTLIDTNPADFLTLPDFPRLRSLTLHTTIDGLVADCEVLAQHWFPHLPVNLHSLSLKLALFDECVFDLLERWGELRKLSIKVTGFCGDRERIKQKGEGFRGLAKLEVLSIQIDPFKFVNCYFFLESLTRGGAGQSLTKLILHVPHSIHWDKEIDVHFDELPRLRCFILHLVNIPFDYSGTKRPVPLIKPNKQSVSVTSFTVTGLTHLDNELADNLAKVFPALAELNIRAFNFETYRQPGDVVVELVRANPRLRVLRFIDDYEKPISHVAIIEMAKRSISSSFKAMHEMRFPIDAEAHVQIVRFWPKTLTNAINAILRDAKWFRLY